MGFTSPPPPPDKVAEFLWTLSTTLDTGHAPTVTFDSLTAEEQKKWNILAVAAVHMIHPAPTPPSST